MTTENKLINSIKSITHVPDEQIEKLLTISHLKNVDKGYCFIREGDFPGNFAFVINVGGANLLYFVTKIAPSFTFKKLNSF